MPLVTIEIPEEAYLAVQQQALNGGFETTERYISDIVVSTAMHDSENFDHIFTADIIADLNTISRGIEAGEKTFTMDEVHDRLAETRRKWLANEVR